MQTINLGQTIYGGYLNVPTGVLTVTWSDKFTIDGSVSVVSVAQSGGVYYISVRTNLTGVNTTLSNKTVISDKMKTSTGLVADNRCYITNGGATLVCILSDQTITTKEQANQWFSDNPTTFCYELATPQTYQLTPAQIEQLLGQNNVFCSTGDVAVKYYDHMTIEELNRDYLNSSGTSKFTAGLIRATKESTSTSTNFILSAPNVPELYDGLTVIFRNDATASASGLLLNLNNLGGKQVWASYQNTRVTTGLGANVEYILYFDYANDRWVKYEGTYTANTNTIGEYAGPAIAGNGNMARYSLIMQTQLNPPRFASLVTTSTTSTNKTKQPCGFIPNGVVLYQSADTYAAGSTAGRTDVWCVISGLDARYSTNISSTTLPEDTPGKAFYIKGTIVGDLFYLADTTWWAVDLPTTADGYYYIYVGQMYSRYQYSLLPNHPIYYHDGTQIQEFIYETSYIGQASGAVAHCPDAIDNTDFREILAYIQATQSGTGDPSPSNIRPISGWSETNVNVEKNNILKYANTSQSGTISGVDYSFSNGRIVLNGTTTGLFTLSLDLAQSANLNPTANKIMFRNNQANMNVNVYFRRSNINIHYWTMNTINRVAETWTDTGNENVDNVTIIIGANTILSNFVLFPLLCEKTYNPTTYTINLGGTYYGGYLNVPTGLMTVTYLKVDLGSLAWQYNATYNRFYAPLETKEVAFTTKPNYLCDIYKTVERMTNASWSSSTDDLFITQINNTNIGIRDNSYSGDYTQLKTDLSGHYLVYELATPQTVQLTPAQLEQLLGQNNVWADSGDINVEYYRNTAIAHAVQDLAPIDHLGFWRDDNGCLCQG